MSSFKSADAEIAIAKAAAEIAVAKAAGNL